LTYPRCDIPKELVLDYFLEIFKVYNVIEYVVAHELHKDGTDHLHIYLKVEEKIEWK